MKSVDNTNKKKKHIKQKKTVTRKMKSVRIGLICALIAFSVCLLPATADPGLHDTFTLHTILWFWVSQYYFFFYFDGHKIATTITAYSKCFMTYKVKQHRKIRAKKSTQYKKFVSALYEKRKTCFVRTFQCVTAMYHEIVCLFVRYRLTYNHAR